ncbi:MAG: hypothetical protein M3O61_13195 [Gemmatimonadota bacterium]|nr:hypothetical protein [Gemmatimonadota bacterium]
MAKTIRLEDRLKTPVITQVPLRVREQMEKMARQRKVSLSEIGRRALQAYVEKEA